MDDENPLRVNELSIYYLLGFTSAKLQLGNLTNELMSSKTVLGFLTIDRKRIGESENLRRFSEVEQRILTAEYRSQFIRVELKPCVVWFEGLGPLDLEVFLHVHAQGLVIVTFHLEIRQSCDTSTVIKLQSIENSLLKIKLPERKEPRALTLRQCARWYLDELGMEIGTNNQTREDTILTSYTLTAIRKTDPSYEDLKGYLDNHPAQINGLITRHPFWWARDMEKIKKRLEENVSHRRDLGLYVGINNFLLLFTKNAQDFTQKRADDTGVSMEDMLRTTELYDFMGAEIVQMEYLLLKAYDRTLSSLLSKAEEGRPSYIAQIRAEIAIGLDAYYHVKITPSEVGWAEISAGKEALGLSQLFEIVRQKLEMLDGSVAARFNEENERRQIELLGHIDKMISETEATKEAEQTTSLAINLLNLIISASVAFSIVELFVPRSINVIQVGNLSIPTPAIYLLSWILLASVLFGTAQVIKRRKLKQMRAKEVRNHDV